MQLYLFRFQAGYQNRSIYIQKMLPTYSKLFYYSATYFAYLITIVLGKSNLVSNSSKYVVYDALGLNDFCCVEVKGNILVS